MKIENALGNKNPRDVVLGFVIEGSGTVNGLTANAEDIFAFEPGESVEIKGSLKLMKISAK